jgi:sugar O-acyltransferase (sialic acid O-acetyltransferase NeuD family)
MHSCRGLLILGFGGHARSVADVALAAGYEALLFIDENAREGENFLGHPVQRTWPARLPEDWVCLPAAGDNRKRQRQLAALQEAGWPLATLIAPTATIGAGATVAPACFIAHHAHVGPLARIGLGTILNTGAIVEHDCQVGEFSHVSVNAAVAGRSRIGKFVFIGAGATVIDDVTVGDDIMIGAGGLVIASIGKAGTYVGAPARWIKHID